MRSGDILIALLALLFFLPLMLVIAAVGVYGAGTHILFSQERIGLDGRRFGCLKFRTMVPDAEQRLSRLLMSDPAARLEWDLHQKLCDDPRVTPWGRFLRKSSLDELPQLMNVLRGDMSIVGPRPIVDAEIARYGRHFRHYCAVRPGITGLWQVSGRSDASYRRRIACDVLYARRRSALVNARIILATIPAVMLARGSY